MMDEEPVYRQLGISELRYKVIEAEVKSVLMTREKSGTMLTMIESNLKLDKNEKLCAIFMLAKKNVENRLVARLPMLKSVLGGS